MTAIIENYNIEEQEELYKLLKKKFANKTNNTWYDKNKAKKWTCEVCVKTVSITAKSEHMHGKFHLLKLQLNELKLNN